MVKVLFASFLVVFLAWEAAGHGMMIDPPNRSSAWRFDPTFPANYDDNQNYCGGASVQHQQNNHQCGLCGDNYVDPRPRANENTGTYGTGRSVATYQSGSVITVTIKLTANHKGTFTYSLCKLDNPSAPEPEDCFVDLPLADGRLSREVPPETFELKDDLQLPAGLTCDLCVLRWHYVAGNSWGNCDDGTQAAGCGDQETFRTCTDITIV